MLKRNHPATACCWCVAQLDPAADARSDARRRERVRRRRRYRSPELQAAIKRLLRSRSPAVRGDVFAFIGAKGGVGTTTVAVNVATALAKAEPGLDAADRPEHRVRRRRGVPGREPRFSVMDALENVQRLDAAFFSGLVVRSKSGLDLLGASGRPVTGDVRYGADARRCSNLPARRIATRCSTCRAPTPAALDALDGATKIVLVVEPGTGDRPERQPHGGDAAAALRPEPPEAGAHPHRSARRDRARRRASGRSGSRCAHVPERLPPGAAGDEQGAPARRSTTTDELSSAFTTFARELAGIRQTHSRKKKRGPGACSAGSRRARRDLIRRRMDDTMSRLMATDRAAPGVDTRSSHYQELKSRIHQDLLNRLNLERLTRIRRDEARTGDPEPDRRDARARERGHAAQPVRARRR